MKDKNELVADDAAPSNMLPIAENLFAPEVYADTAAFFTLKSGHSIQITFSSLRYDNSSVPAVLRNVIVGRLVMPAGGAVDLVDSLNDYLRRHGLRPDKAGAN